MTILSEKLRNKIRDKEARIGIIGMGYVGIPLGLEFANNGFNVLGFDKDNKRIDAINEGKQVMKHIKQKDMAGYLTKDGSATNDVSKLNEMDCNGNCPFCIGC